MSFASVVWLRLDLRLADNPALQAAVKRGGPVIPLFIWAPEEETPWEPGGASRWWLHQSLKALDGELRKTGSRLTLRQGPSLENLSAVLRATGARAVFWNRRYEPAVQIRDRRVEAALRSSGVAVETFNGSLLHEPAAIRNQSGKPFKVFTPFWKHCLSLPDPVPPLGLPKTIRAPQKWPKSIPLAALELEPKVCWYQGLQAQWTPGARPAEARLCSFVQQQFSDYGELRNRPDLAGTSRLSPHLHYGEISPRQVWHAVRGQKRKEAVDGWRGSPFLAEIGWREFAHHLLFHYPATTGEPLRKEFANFPWRQSERMLQSWQRGQTGYPIVDAGMRELWTTGWMHNRVRMIVGSFLVKDLLIFWQAGSRWFWDTLVDADLANNTLGWQWTAGCGADAALFFRIFNPTLQGQKFDPQGAYIRRWCPELARLPDRWIHDPGRAPLEVLKGVGIKPGTTYPIPVVSHTIAREVALEQFSRLKRG